MIPFDFIYLRPDSLKEATDAYMELNSEGKSVVYYSGGSEIITMCRVGSIHPDAVIDIKNIPECKMQSVNGGKLNIGSACTLNQIKEYKQFPLLGLACGRIADHTNQCRITLGGNLCGKIIYRETSLPLLLSDSQITLSGPDEKRTLDFQSVFNGQVQLELGELIEQVHIPEWALSARYSHVKKTANEKIDYPLVSAAALWNNDCIRIAFSGICSYPFRSEQIEAVLNDRSKSCKDRTEEAAMLLPEESYCDVEASGEYRLFVFKETVLSILEDWENGKI